MKGETGAELPITIIKPIISIRIRMGVSHHLFLVFMKSMNSKNMLLFFGIFSKEYRFLLNFSKKAINLLLKPRCPRYPFGCLLFL
jgi:hypothetical protein